MSLRKIADEALNTIDKTTGGELSKSQKQEVLKIIEQALADSAESVSATHREVTVICCGPEADLAHKIAEESDLALAALTANLMSLR